MLPQLIAAAMFFQASSARLPSLQLLMPDGTARYVVLDSSLVVDKATTPWTLRAVTNISQLPLKEEVAVLNPDGSWHITMPPVSAPIVSRNGLIMRRGRDYTLSGSNIMFSAAVGSLPTDTILVHFQ